MTLPQIEDVTDRFGDVNAYDRLYRCTRGYIIKVRVTDRSATPSALAFEVTGSWADDATGKARRFGASRHFIVSPHELAVHSETETDVAAEVEKARLLMVERVSLAAANHYARQALQGVRATPKTIS